MKIFVDENIPLITVKQLRSMGFDVTDIRGTPDQGMIDELLWKRTQKEKRLLITTDKGFSTYRNEAHYGILIIRLKQPTRLKIHQHIMQAISKHSEQDWPGLLAVMRDSVQSTWRST
jgi:predicted nuclease of predicted toxin-antitoxin system